jgi:16S rRNA (guanine527-N7)-methyltransferase
MSEVGSAPEAFLAASRDLGIAINAGDLDRLEAYLRLLYDANQRMNLTGIRDPENGWLHLVLDSLTLMPWIAATAESQESVALIDVGSGGGCPGLPLACVFPEVSVTLLDSTRKKTAFLEDAAGALELSNVRVVTERAEVAGRDALHRAQYDLVLSRAVGRLPVLLEYTVPLAREGGLILAIKGAKADEEVAEAKMALHALHAVVLEVTPTPTGRIISIKKQRKTPAKFPRGLGEPSKNPLGSA